MPIDNQKSAGGAGMTQEDINEIMWKCMPDWQKEQIASQNDNAAVRHIRELTARLEASIAESKSWELIAEKRLDWMDALHDCMMLAGNPDSSEGCRLVIKRVREALEK
jgi:hypothetical protein